MSQACKHNFEFKLNNGGGDDEEQVCSRCGKDRNDVIHARKGTIHGFDAATEDSPCIHCSEARAHGLHWYPHHYVSSSAWRNTECMTCGLPVGASVHSATPANPLVGAGDAKVKSTSTDSANYAFDFLQGVAKSEPSNLGEDLFLISLASGLEWISRDGKFFLGRADELALQGRFERLLATPRVAGNKFASMLIHVAASVASQHLIPRNQNEFVGESFFETSVVQALKNFVEIEPAAIDVFAKLGARAPYFCIDKYRLLCVCFSNPMLKILSPQDQLPFGNNALSVVFVVLRFVLLLGTKPKIESGSFTDAQYFITHLSDQREFPAHVDDIIKDLEPELLVEPIQKIVRLAVVKPLCPTHFAGNFVPVLACFGISFHSLVSRFNQLPSKRQLVIDNELSQKNTGFWLTALEAVDSIDVQKALWTEAIKSYNKLGICDRVQDIAYLIWQSTNDSSLRSVAFSVFNDETGKVGPLPSPSPSVFNFFALADDIDNPVYERRHFNLLQEWTETIIKTGFDFKPLVDLFDGIVTLAPAGSNRAALLLAEPCRILIDTFAKNNNLLKGHIVLLLAHKFPSANGELARFICKTIIEVYGRTNSSSPTMSYLLLVLNSSANSLSNKHWNDFRDAGDDKYWLTGYASEVIPQGTLFDFKEPLKQWFANPDFTCFPTNDVMYASGNDGEIRPSFLCFVIRRIFSAAITQCTSVCSVDLEDTLNKSIRYFDQDDSRRATVFHFVDALVLELLQNRQGNNTFLDGSAAAIEVLSSSHRQILSLPDTDLAPVDLVSVALTQFSANADREISQVFPNNAVDPEKITLEKVIRIESLLKVIPSKTLDTLQSRTKNVLIPAAKKEFEQLKAECSSSFISELESLVPLFPTVRDFITNKNNLDSVVKDFDKTTLAVIASVRDFLQQLRGDLDCENITFALRCLPAKAKSQISSFFLSEKNPQAISSVDGAREALNDARTRSTQFFLTFTAQQIKNTVSKLPPGAFNLETELKLHEGIIRAMPDFDTKRLPILQKYDILVECKTLANGFKKLGCVNQAGAAAIEIVADSSTVDPAMLRVLTPYANNANFIRFIGLLDNQSAKIRVFLATRKIDDPVECAKLFKKIQEIQRQLQKKKNDQSLALMDKFVAAREFLVASVLDAHKITDDAASRDVIADIRASPTLLALLRWCETNSKNVQLLLDIESAMAELDQNADRIRDIVKNFEKFDWFRVGCLKHGIAFPGEDHESVIECLEHERVTSPEIFQSLGHSTIDSKFPAGHVAPLRQLQRCLSCQYLENVTAQKAFDQLRRLFDQKCVILHPSNLKKGEKLGRGGYGEVSSATITTRCNMPCAAKYIKWQNAGDANEEAFKELRNYDGLCDDNISHLIGASVEDSDNPHIIILTKLASSNLESFLEEFSLSATQARNFSLEIARGIAYLHSHGIIHSDLKPTNILVFREKYKTSLRLCDFGSVHRLETSNSQLVKSKVCSTANYIPPETVLSPHGRIQVTRRNDVFAFGVILLQMIAPRWFGNGGWNAIADKIRSLRLDEIRGNSESCIDINNVIMCDSEEMKNSGLLEIAEKCLMIDPDKRWRDGDELMTALGGSDEKFERNDAGAAFGSSESSNQTSAQKKSHSVSFSKDGFRHVEHPGTGSLQGDLHSGLQSLDQPI